MKNNVPDFNEPLWKLAAKIADVASYCGPTKTIGVKNFDDDYKTTTTYIFGFEMMRATKLIHAILEQELLKVQAERIRKWRNTKGKTSE